MKCKFLRKEESYKATIGDVLILENNLRVLVASFDYNRPLNYINLDTMMSIQSNHLPMSEKTYSVGDVFLEADEETQAIKVRRIIHANALILKELTKEEI